jgi:hypothetical protein
MQIIDPLLLTVLFLLIDFWGWLIMEEDLRPNALLSTIIPRLTLLFLATGCFSRKSILFKTPPPPPVLLGF